MEQSLRRFARKILLVHLALLGVLLAVVFFASREVYHSAREQALNQAREQQSLLVSQTARGLKSYYDSLFGDLDLLKPVNPDDESDDGDPSPFEPTDVLPWKQGGPRALRITPLLAMQLNGRISHLFVVDKKALVPQTMGRQATNPPVQDVIERYKDWIGNLQAPSVSRFEKFGDHGLNLVGIPVGIRRNMVAVASVPIRTVAKRFLDDLNRHSTSGAVLIDERQTIMAASRPALVGTHLGTDGDAQVMAAMRELQAKSDSGTLVLTRPFDLAGEHFQPAMVTMQPIKVLDKQWSLLIASPLSRVDAVVSQLFRRAVLWAVFVAFAMTAILVSTAIQMIRSRVRLERVRSELLERELKQARMIQLAWLPERAGRRGRVDIATHNLPATQVSGDFYNWFELPDGRLCVTIGDVTGHGLPAAFLMATTQLLVRNTMPLCREPGPCMEEVNRQLCTQVFNGQFVTLQILVIDPQQGRLEIATAGHPAPLLGDGESFQPLPLEPQLVLGVDKDATYLTERFDLPASAAMLLYTDGVVDALAASGDRLGLDRLRRPLYGRFDSAEALLGAVLTSIESFRKGCKLCDDLTLVAIQIEPQPAAETTEQHEVTVA